MKLDAGRWAVVVLLSIFMLACTSIRARTEILRHDRWTVYPGAKQGVKEMGQLIRGEHAQSSKDIDSEAGWMKGIIAAILAVDLPFSTLFDTVAIPYDLYRKDNPQKFKKDRKPSDDEKPPSDLEQHR